MGTSACAGIGSSGKEAAKPKWLSWPQSCQQDGVIFVKGASHGIRNISLARSTATHRACDAFRSFQRIESIDCPSYFRPAPDAEAFCDCAKNAQAAIHATVEEDAEKETESATTAPTTKTRMCRGARLEMFDEHKEIEGTAALLRLDVQHYLSRIEAAATKIKAQLPDGGLSCPGDGFGRVKKGDVAKAIDYALRHFRKVYRSKNLPPCDGGE